MLTQVPGLLAEASVSSPDASSRKESFSEAPGFFSTWPRVLLGLAEANQQNKTVSSVSHAYMATSMASR